MEITAKNLSKRFNHEWIFRDFNYTFSGGNIYAITGANGSGKSTLLQVLWGQLPASGGTITYMDSNNYIPLDNLYRYTAIATPYMDLIDELTLTEQLTFHFKMKKSRHGMGVDEIIEKMYLSDARHKTLANFSSGMKQRVKLGMAFFTDAPLIFLDEPSTNLDEKAFTWYLTQLNALPSEALVLIASNQPLEYPEKASLINILNYK